MSFARRKHPRRQPPAVHRPPPVAPETPDEVLARALDVPVPVVSEPSPPLSKAQVAKLEALTAVWMRDTRLGGPQPEDTLLYAAPKPPPPPRREPPQYAEDPTPRRDVDVEEQPPAPHTPVISPEGAVIPHATEEKSSPPRVVRDWVSRHDERSRAFDVKARLRARVPVQDRVWPIGPVFDQGTTPPLSLRDASGCVGMATAAAANVLALAAPMENRPAWPLLEKAAALSLYDRAQDAFDHVSGKAYAGTSVLAGMLAGREAGLWAEFLWAFGTRDVAQAVLQVGPVVIGIPWDEHLEEPDRYGIVRPGGASMGGHALAVVGILADLRKRTEVSLKPGIGAEPGPYFVLQQSRGEAEGDRGLVYLHHKHLAALLAGVGEAAIPVPPGGLP